MKTALVVLLILVSIAMILVGCDLINEVATVLTAKQAFAFIDPVIALA